jgi:cytochrome d ubiquinol oxidase subunit I
MVALGLFFIAFFAIVWYLNKKGTLQKVKWLLWLGVISIPLAYITSQSGWIVAEVGRQPWSIQDVLPLSHSVSNIPVANVKTTFFIFLGIFTIFLIADIGIMINTIRKGPEAVDESKGY